MKQTFKLSFFALFAALVFGLASCEENKSVDCDTLAVDISYVVDSIGVTLTATATGGEPEYDYLWSTGESSSTIIVDADGTYTVVVTDANDCTVEETFIVDSTNPCNMFAVNITNTVDPASGNYVLTAEVTGGTEPYSYLWSTGEITATIVYNIPGNYSVTVLDAENCDASSDIDVTQGGPCDSFTAVVYAITDSIDMSISLESSVSGGTLPYTYQWSTGDTGSSIDIPNEDGTYILVVTDANGCTIANTINYMMTDPCAFTANIYEETNPASGVVSLTAFVVSGGTAPFTYLWNTGETTSSIVVTDSGLYTVLITDSSGCSFEAVYNYLMIGDCSIFTVDIIVSPDSNSTMISLYADATLGTAPYTYLWSSGEISPAISVDGSGIRYVTVTDSNNCQAEDFTQF